MLEVITDIDRETNSRTMTDLAVILEGKNTFDLNNFCCVLSKALKQIIKSTNILPC